MNVRFVLLCVAASFSHTGALQDANVPVGSFNAIHPDRVSCDASYNVPCSRANFESTIFDINFSEDFKVENSFYVFIYSYSGMLKAHGVLRDYFRHEISRIFQDKQRGSNKNDSLRDDFSACCIHDGNTTSSAHQTWQLLLEMQEITSVQGLDLRTRFLERDNSGGGWLNYPWSTQTGLAQNKLAFTARYRLNNEIFYIVAEYLITTQPPTCDACPSDMECTRDGQSYCTKKPQYPLLNSQMVISLIVFFSVGTPLLAFFLWNQRLQSQAKSRQELNKQMRQMAQQMQRQMPGIVEVKTHMPGAYSEKIKSDGRDSSGATTTHALWYWKEDDPHRQSHASEMVLSNTGFVHFTTEVTEQLEREYQRWKKGHGYRYFHLDLTNKFASTTHGGKAHYDETDLVYKIDFQAMTQQNSLSEYTREIRRQEVKMQMGSEVEIPPLPENIDFGKGGENLLPVRVGQVIHVSKRHSDGLWLFGTLLFDPLIHEATKQNENQSDTALRDIFSRALYDRPTSGWFTKGLVQPADTNVMQKLLKNIGGAEGLEALSIPKEWERDETRTHTYRVGKIEVEQGTKEWKEVNNYFRKNWSSRRRNVEPIKLEKIERIQNLQLYQTYLVKKLIIANRHKHFPQHRENSKNWQDVERRWLFHGTADKMVEAITEQGFNRSYAGRNAVAYGKGIYFARDASYSSQEKFAVPDEHGVQRMLFCRVVVGDWCKGIRGQLLPDSKRHNSYELFDTTVNDVLRPSIFVVYHDAQAYPEYLVSFKKRG